MKKYLQSFRLFLKEITQDYMVFACIIGPFIMALAFFLGVRPLEAYLTKVMNQEEVLKPYFILFDMLVSIMAPILFSFAGVLVILEEQDINITKYFSVTPLEKKGYFISRIVFLTVIGFFYDVFLLSLFNLSKISFPFILLFGLSSTLLAITVSLFVLSFAHNKMEGMGLVKLSGILLMGVPIAYFIKTPLRYLFAVFPSFWIGEFLQTKNVLYSLLSMVTSLFFIFIFFRIFKRKMA